MKKYLLKYTLEFLVIFLGISLSFFINNWNESNKNEELEIKYLKSLKEEYESNLMLFDQSFSHHIPRWNNLDVFFNFSNKNSFEEMDSVVNILTINWSFNPNLGATNSLISSGYIELLKNDEIKKLVSRMPFLIDDYTEEEKRTELVCVEMGYYLTEHYVYNPRNEKEKKQCVNLILSTPFRNKIYDMQLWLESIILEGPVLRKNFVRLIELIENEILVRTDN
ncbi:DUF6090 family protein [Flavobacteriaceae bacterium]|jgi:hypothetical protein|nr:DUF6090 family protein [Flavobacteriaceae bacterium]MDA9364516.1 DUF6090 family protein [Flavobacteriaceae bacterium]MDA9929378.1 DUF6090 family protein [Flavobacteriaceae bacterium]MDC0107889.1 DUF6090 family protein [Flavobacteriaceae bacterium]MDC0119416.1 DUF6090 family protein [Flavobacteriaceae bacterium]